ncbi:thioredoxin domain-containing protein 12-like isoform X2 [Biomphalaria glabrata]|uniref:Thioredoxin domain-containing protein 12-like isoform X2 n=1 Tax=Biomphalaria glabrata TaxID=6526 RepID=A0A9W3AFK9_BIOGL|nr:thioredoxin domain-containing protein 12-like isoform X2 [Biomphalaria glabrata]
MKVESLQMSFRKFKLLMLPNQKKYYYCIIERSGNRTCIMAPFFMFAASTVFGTVAAAAESWGKNIKWVTMKEAQKLAKEQNKPTMILVTKTWCRACKALRPKFASHPEIEKMSSEFIMVNMEDEDEVKNPDLQPDGTYFPRILFLDQHGHLMKNIMYKKSGAYKYYYPDPKSIVDSMNEVLRAAGQKVIKGKEL